MKDIFKVVVGFLALIAFFAILGLALGWFNLATQRPMAKYQAETDAQTYDTSRQYQQATNRDVARYCEQMRNASTPSAKKAVAALIRSTVSTYEGPLNDDNKTCVGEAQEN